MATTYTLSSGGFTAKRSSDGADVPWDAEADRPLDMGGLAGRTWVDDGSPASLPAAASSPAVPDSVTRLQGRLALSRAGLIDKAEAAIAAAGGETAIWYADAQTWRRDDPHVAAIGQALGLAADQVDALYVTAAAIV